MSFTDSDGRNWRAWNVTPEALARRDYLDPEFRTGWLCFQAEDTGERRRLAQVPDGWEFLAADRLEMLCRAAAQVSLRVDPVDAAHDGDRGGGERERERARSFGSTADGTDAMAR